MPPDWYSKALGLICALIAVILAMVGVAVQAQSLEPDELLAVTPPAGWAAYPPNRLTLDDGDQGSIYLLRDLEHLGV